MKKKNKRQFKSKSDYLSKSICTEIVLVYLLIMIDFFPLSK